MTAFGGLKEGVQPEDVFPSLRLIFRSSRRPDEITDDDLDQLKETQQSLRWTFKQRGIN